jgi:hypothetical protein
MVRATSTGRRISPVRAGRRVRAMRQMSAEKTTEFVPVNFLPAKVDCERRADGAIALRSPKPLRDYPRRIG